MAKKHQLRQTRSGTVINITSQKQEKLLVEVMYTVATAIEDEWPKLSLSHSSQLHLKTVVNQLQHAFSGIDFHYHFDSSSMRPDGGILSILDSNGIQHPLLITERKNQGTNDLRAEEGKKKQAKGNAIERLGKNVIGFRSFFLTESIFPFVCFGDGCDFAEDSSIRDRVTTIAMFGNLNKTYLHNVGPNGIFNRGSFYFRERPWTVEEMTTICKDIARRSVHYYFSKYGEEAFSHRSD